VVIHNERVRDVAQQNWIVMGLQRSLCIVTIKKRIQHGIARVISNNVLASQHITRPHAGHGSFDM
jgi:hypothetical protein